MTKRGLELSCQRCGHGWTYMGSSEWYASCPRCKTTVRVRRLNTERMLERAVSYLSERGVRKIAVFGSRARGEARPDSDLDLLVELPSGMSLLDHARMERELSKALGVKVELVPRDALTHLHEYIKKDVRELCEG